MTQGNLTVTKQLLLFVPKIVIILYHHSVVVIVSIFSSCVIIVVTVDTIAAAVVVPGLLQKSLTKKIINQSEWMDVPPTSQTDHCTAYNC